MSRIQIGTAAVAAAAVLVMATPASAAESLPEGTESTFVTLAGSEAAESTSFLGEQFTIEIANIDTGPSKWEGRELRHPDGGKIPKEVTRWANLVQAVMNEQDIPDRHLEGILAQIQQESFGNPKTVNTWDVNAANGDPSKGLLQVIGATYQSYAKDGYKNTKYQDVPYTNIYAALAYVQDTYGMAKFKSWNGGANHGY